MKNFIIFSTIDNEEKGKEIGKILVEERLAACVNIIPSVESIYIWENNTVIDNENILIIKVSSGCLEKAINRIRELHPYEIPEIIAVKIEKGNKEYLNWIDKGCGGNK